MVVIGKIRLPLLPAGWSGTTYMSATISLFNLMLS